MRAALAWLGGAALLCAAAIDTIAVVGRHTGFPLRGSIELIQPAILLAGSIAILVATLMRAHARVRLVIERLGPALRALADRFSEMATLILLGSLLAGSAWLSFDLWNAHEVSEIVEVPWRWMRLAANLLLVATLAVSAIRLVRGGREP